MTISRQSLGQWAKAESFQRAEGRVNKVKRTCIKNSPFATLRPEFSRSVYEIFVKTCPASFRADFILVFSLFPELLLWQILFDFPCVGLLPSLSWFSSNFSHSPDSQFEGDYLLQRIRHIDRWACFSSKTCLSRDQELTGCTTFCRVSSIQSICASNLQIPKAVFSTFSGRTATQFVWPSQRLTHVTLTA